MTAAFKAVNTASPSTAQQAAFHVLMLTLIVRDVRTVFTCMSRVYHVTRYWMIMNYNERPPSAVKSTDKSENHIYRDVYNHGRLTLAEKVELRKASEWRANIKPMTRECDPLKAGRPQDLDELFDLWRAQREAGQQER